MWSQPRARPAALKNSTTPSRRSAAPPPWCRWRCADYEGIARLAGALNERYGKLDILIGNAALGGSNSPLDHFDAERSGTRCWR
jgi:NAD(P)-dependent dehydrogenase (short-subunit alcohol dehydrogenase family)